MAYTIGTRHVLSGAGSVPVSSPFGVKVALTAIPVYVSQRLGTPTEYFSLGTLALGNADGYLPALWLHHAAGLFLPIPDGMTLLGYSLEGGTIATVDELLAVPDLHTLQPWDRNASWWSQSGFSSTVPGPTTNATNWTYTVPAGKLLLVDAMTATATRTTVATTPANVQVAIAVNAQQVIALSLRSNVAGERDAEYAQTPMVLHAGDVIAASWLNADTGGNVAVRAYAHGILFDA